MKKKLLILSCLQLILLISTAKLFAIGIGVYLGGGGGTTVWKKWIKKNVSEYNIGGGLILDTNCAGRSLFNYRLTLGGESLTTHFTQKQPLIYFIDSVHQKKNFYIKREFNTSLLSITNTFGFGLVRKKAIRLWLGPEIILEGMLGSVKGLYFGLGLALGVNINIGDYLTISITGSGRFKGGFRIHRYRYLDTFCTYNYYLKFGIPVLQIRSDKSPRLGYGGSGMATVAFMYRIRGS